MTRRITTLARRALVIGAGLATLGAAACAGAPVEPSARVWMTSGDRSRLLSEQAPLRFESSPTAGEATVAIDPRRQFQEMVGFGAAITDASAWLPTRSAIDRHDSASDGASEEVWLMRQAFVGWKRATRS